MNTTHICNNCGIPKGEHRAGNYACPNGKISEGGYSATHCFILKMDDAPSDMEQRLFALESRVATLERKAGEHRRLKK